jgi:energy-coupling factor transporter ATP-binding protein EcfA2
MVFSLSTTLLTRDMMTFTTRSWSGVAVLLCVLLLQNCQSNSLRVTQEKEPTTSSSSASTMRQRAFSGHLAVRSSTFLSASFAAQGSSSSLSTIPAHEEDRSASLPARSSSSVAPSARAAISNTLAAPHHLPAAAMPGASRAVPLGNALGALSPVFTTSSGERVRFSQADGQWRAAMQAGYGSAALQRILPVVGPADVGNFLFWLQSQAQWTSRARIHILEMPQAPYGPCVYLGRAGLLGGVPSQRVDQASRTAVSMAFGPQEWNRYYGKVGATPPLPADIDAILRSRCPFWPEKKVEDTHLLVLIPATVDGEPFTLNLLEKRIKSPKNGGKATEYRHYHHTVKSEIGTVSPPASYWLLMTRYVLPKSRGKGYGDQKKLVVGHARCTGLPYEVPKVLEAATAVLTHHVQDGVRLYGENPSIFTRCQDLVLYESKKYPALVGGFGPSGLYVQNPCTYTSDQIRGVAACLRFHAAKGLKTPPANQQSFSTASLTPTTAVGNATSAVPDEVVVTASSANDACSQDDSCWRGSVEGDKLEDISVFTGLTDLTSTRSTLPETVNAKQLGKRQFFGPKGEFTNKQSRYSQGSESDMLEVWGSVTQHNQAPEPDSEPPVQSRVSPPSSVARDSSSVNASSTTTTSTAAPFQEMDLSSAAMQALLSKKLANPNHALSDQESIALLNHCIAEGARNADKIKGKDALVVVGNTGAGKSTFLNYLLGCDMIKKSLRELGIEGVGKVVVVKSRSEGGCLDEVMAIGHAELSKTFIPQIEVDRSDATVAYCDCPGFLDNRGAEINIANAVNIRHVLQSARSTKVLVLINYHTLKSDRGKGFHDMLGIFKQLFGDNSQLLHHKDSLLLSITRAPSDEAILSDFREWLSGWLSKNTSDALTTLCDNLFLYDPLENGLEGYLSRSACREALHNLKSIPQSASSKLFQSVLTDSDERELVKIMESQSASLRSLLDASRYAQAASCWQALARLRVIDNLSVERLLHLSATRLSSNFSKLKIAFEDACCSYDFSRSDSLLNTLSQIARDFTEEVCNFSLPTLQDCHSESKERHAAQERERLENEEAIRGVAASERARLIEVMENQKQTIESQLTALKAAHQKAQKMLQEEKEHDNKRYAEQVEKLKGELAEGIRKKIESVSLQKLSSEEREQLLNREQLALRHEHEEKLSAVRKEQEASEQAYEALLEKQQTSQHALQASLEARIAELSRRQAEEGEQLQSLRIPAMAFGPQEWKQYYGEVGRPVPDLPSGIDETLDSACPFWPDKKIRDTHLLVLLPATVDGAPFTLNLLKELVKRPKSGGHRTEYRYYDGHAVQERIGNNALDRSYWLLMTRDILPESRCNTYAGQKALIVDYASRTGLPYELPKALEAATAILTHYVRSGERLYSDDPLTFTRCQELIDGKYSVVVGEFESSGLIVNSFIFAHAHDGVAGLRKFS